MNEGEKKSVHGRKQSAAAEKMMVRMSRYTGIAPRELLCAIEENMDMRGSDGKGSLE